MKHILLIEEDEKIAALAGLHLKDIDCSTDHAAGGVDGLDRALHYHYDLIVLDMELRDAAGSELLGRLRREKSGTPLMILITKQEEADTTATGIYDYLLKPFSIGEFTARIKALLHTAAVQQEESVTADLIVRGPLRMDTTKREVTFEERPLELSHKEFDLLQVLMAHPGRSFTPESLLSQIWGHGFAGFEHTITTSISHLRARIEDDPLHPVFILTTWGTGYRFTDEY